jgi:hypothetical protein
MGPVVEAPTVASVLAKISSFFPKLITTLFSWTQQHWFTSIQHANNVMQQSIQNSANDSSSMEGMWLSIRMLY